MMRHKERM